MANNPFYPGYIPGKDSPPPNPMYPGYYPGSAMARKPTPKGFVKPIEYNFDSVYDFIDSLDVNPAGVPRWIKDRIVDDFKQNLKSEIKPSSIPADELDDYDADALPGAMGIGFDLNPESWLVDPKGRKSTEQVIKDKAKKTVKEWVTSITDRKDFENRVKEEIWSQVFSQNPRYGETPFREEAVKAAGERLKTYGGPNDLSLEGLNIFNAKNVDVFGSVRKNVAEFQQRASADALRDKTHDAFLKASVDAVRSEMSERQIQGIINSWGAADPRNVAYRNFNTKVGLLDKISDVGKAKFELLDELPKVSLEGGARGIKELANLDRATRDARRWIATNGASLTPRDRERLLNLFEKHLGSIEGVINPLKTGGSIDPAKVSSRFSRAAGVYYPLNLTPADVKAPLTGGNIFTESLERKLARDLVEQDLYRPGIRGWRGPATMSDVFTGIENTPGVNIDIKSKRLTPYIGRLKFEREMNLIDEFLNNLDKGVPQVLERYVWNRYIKPKITSSYFMGAAVSDVARNLGIQINRDDKFERSILGAINNSVLKSGDGPGKVFGNYFDASFQVGGRTISSNLYGGSHFKFFTKSDLFKDYSSTLKRAGRQLTDAQMAYLLRTGGILPRGYRGTIGTDDLNQLRAFRSWVLSHRSRFKNLTTADLVSDDFWLKLAKSLKDKKYISIDKKYAGWLEKTWQGLNKIQDAVAANPIFKHTVGTYINVKNAIVDAAATVASKILAEAAAALSAATGIGVVIVPIVDKITKFVVKWVVRNVVNTAENFVNAVRKQEFAEFIDSLGSSIYKLSLIIAGIVVVPVIIGLLVSTFFFGAVLTTLSPIDTSRAVTIAGRGGGNIPAGPGPENALAKIEKDATVTYLDPGSGETIVKINPTIPLPNSILSAGSINVSYEVRIIPKISILDALTGGSAPATPIDPNTVEIYLDDVAKILKNESFAETPLFEQKDIKINATEFIVGSVIKKTFGPFSIRDPKHTDSLVDNKATLRMPPVPSAGLNGPSEIIAGRSFVIGKFGGGCPVCKGLVTNGSLGGGIGPMHGSQAYWNYMGVGNCGFAIPALTSTGVRWGCPGSKACYTSDPAMKGISPCYNSGGVSYYGYAADYQSGCSGDHNVYAPAGGTWTVQAKGLEGSAKYWVNISNGSMLIHFLHLSSAVTKSSFSGGEVIGVYDSGWNHTHVEVMINGQPRKPEEVFLQCGK